MSSDNQSGSGNTPDVFPYTIFPYPGSKARHMSWLLNLLPEHHTFVEVFGGSGALMLNKEPSRNEIYNDINEDLTHFFNVLRDQPDELIEYVERVPYSRDLYQKWVNLYYNGYRPADPIARAGQFYFLRHSQFGGDIESENGFRAISNGRRLSSRQFNNTRSRLTHYADRFESVLIEQQDYADIFERYDGEDVLFYCDPPYLGTEHYYGDSGAGFDHDRFIEALNGVSGKWMLSCVDPPSGVDEQDRAVRDTVHGMNSGQTGGGHDVTEHVLFNYDRSEVPSFTDDSQNTLNDWGE